MLIFYFLCSSSQHATASPTHVTEITSGHVASEEQLEVPPPDDVAPPAATGSGIATTAPAAPPATTSAQADPAASTVTLPFLLDHVTSFISVC